MDNCELRTGQALCYRSAELPQYPVPAPLMPTANLNTIAEFLHMLLNITLIVAVDLDEKKPQAEDQGQLRGA